MRTAATLGRLSLLAGLALLVAATVAPAAEKPAPPVAVIYPRLDNENYRAALRQIVGGISETLGPRADVQEVDTKETARDLAARIAARDAGSVLLLGPYGLEMARQLDPALDRVVGAVFAGPAKLPPGARGISIVPAPRVLFGKLKELVPAITRISVVHGMDDNDWLIELAAKDAAQLGYAFEATRRDNLGDGAKAYRDLLARMNPQHEALWLPQASRFLAETSILKMILGTAWDRNIVVFSSNGALVQSGALFALVPDNAAMGRALGAMAAAPPAAGAGLQLLEELDTAINIRTANHLGLGFDAADPRFDLVLPSR